MAIWEIELQLNRINRNYSEFIKSTGPHLTISRMLLMEFSKINILWKTTFDFFYCKTMLLLNTSLTEKFTLLQNMMRLEKLHSVYCTSATTTCS